MGFLRSEIASRLLARTTFIPLLVVAGVLLFGGMFFEQQNQRIYNEQQRSTAVKELAVIRARLEGNINSDVQLVRGLVATISAEPNISNSRFAALSSGIMNSLTHLINVTAAPNLVVTMVFPAEGNEAVLGLDYMKNDAQREAALRARDSGQAMVAGPINLVQGGEGLVLRVPVYAKDKAGNDKFWGIVSSAISLKSLYRAVGLGRGSKLDVAILGKDATGRAGPQFYGDPAILDRDPVTADVLLPTGSWHLAATPVGGWETAPADLWWLRSRMILAAVFILVPLLFLSQLIAERARNIDSIKSREKELRRLSRRLNLALDASRVGVWEYDVETHELVWDIRMNELYGTSNESGARTVEQWMAIVHPDDLERATADFRLATSERSRYFSEYRIKLKHGRQRHVRAVGTVFTDQDGSKKMVGVNWDVSTDVALNQDLKRAKKLAEARNEELETAKNHIEYTSLHDALTGLPNRRFLDSVLQSPANWRSNLKEKICLLHLDLDRFKQINDTLGHAAGDAMLVHTAKTLRANVRAEDFVARVGGDEFVILTEHCHENDDGDSLAERIIRDLRQPICHDGHECRIGVSIGIAEGQPTSQELQRMLMNADIALYRAKNRGRNRHEIFSEGLQREVILAKKTADEILEGIEKNQFVVFYQPQFDARTRDIVGVEALVRWVHPIKGLLAPDAFLTVAEEIGALATIDKLVLQQALVDLAKWDAKHFSVPRISVNVSARRLHDENLIKSLDAMNIEPGRIIFELVESVFLDESEEIATWNIDHLRERGIDIEIDDFGTGYASIVSVMKLRPKRLKIDRQLVAPIVSSTMQRKLVSSIIEIGKSLGVGAVAEGVETFQHAEILKDLGCDVLQGYAFGRPMSAQDLEIYIRAETWRVAS